VLARRARNAGGCRHQQPPRRAPDNNRHWHALRVPGGLHATGRVIRPQRHASPRGSIGGRPSRRTKTAHTSGRRVLARRLKKGGGTAPSVSAARRVTGAPPRTTRAIPLLSPSWRTPPPVLPPPGAPPTPARTAGVRRCSRGGVRARAPCRGCGVGQRPRRVWGTDHPPAAATRRAARGRRGGRPPPRRGPPTAASGAAGFCGCRHPRRCRRRRRRRRHRSRRPIAAASATACHRVDASPPRPSSHARLCGGGEDSLAAAACSRPAVCPPAPTMTSTTAAAAATADVGGVGAALAARGRGRRARPGRGLWAVAEVDPRATV